MGYNLVCERCGKDAHIELGKNRDLGEDVVESDVGYCPFCSATRGAHREGMRLEPTGL